MPANRRSLAVTERYRSGMLGLRRRGQAEAKRAWQSVDPANLDGSFPLGQLELSVSTLQREAARLSSGYLSAFISSELGEPATPPPVMVWNRAWGGGDLRTGLRSAIVRTKMAIADGTEPREAVRVNRATLVNDVGLFIDTAARESLRAGMEADERVVGYQRALKGTCGACAGNVTVETSVQLPSVPLMVHPNCQCVTEPVVVKNTRQVKETKLSKADTKAMNEYVSTGQSYSINNFLRMGEKAYRATRRFRWRAAREQGVSFSWPTAASIKRWIAGLDRVFERAGSLRVPVQAWRGMRLTPEQLGLTGKRLAGQTFTDKAFGSATADRSFAQHFLNPPEPWNKPSVLLELRVDPRVKAIWGANPGESELVMQRGCRYVVRSSRRRSTPYGPGQQWHLIVDVLPPE